MFHLIIMKKKCFKRAPPPLDYLEPKNERFTLNKQVYRIIPPSLFTLHMALSDVAAIVPIACCPCERSWLQFLAVCKHGGCNNFNLCIKRSFKQFELQMISSLLYWLIMSASSNSMRISRPIIETSHFMLKSLSMMHHRIKFDLNNCIKLSCMYWFMCLIWNLS